MLSKVKL